MLHRSLLSSLCFAALVLEDALMAFILLLATSTFAVAMPTMYLECQRIEYIVYWRARCPVGWPPFHNGPSTSPYVGDLGSWYLASGAPSSCQSIERQTHAAPMISDHHSTSAPQILSARPQKRLPALAGHQWPPSHLAEIFTGDDVAI